MLNFAAEIIEKSINDQYTTIKGEKDIKLYIADCADARGHGTIGTMR